jgi:5-methylcytosine-specific restriction enzyme A
MTTYLLTWNPAKWPWPELPDCIQEFEATGHRLERWSCGRNRKIVEGDRVFLLRQGLEPRGIVGSGRVATDVFDDWHWDEAKRAAGQRTWCIEVDFDVLLNAEREPILPRAQLNEGVLGQMYWDSQSSGILIPDEVAQQLERKWKQLTTKYQQPTTHDKNSCYRNFL